MAESGIYIDFPSPAYSVPYHYTDVEGYLDSGATSDSASPMASSYDKSFTDNSHTYASPESADGAAEAHSAESSTAQAKPKRKRENRYKNAPPSVLSRRRAQNRASQRAYRERKDQRIKDLEDLLNEAQQRNDVLSQAYSNLQSEYLELKSEQDMASQYPQADLSYDPAMANTLDADFYQYQAMPNYSM